MMRSAIPVIRMDDYGYDLPEDRIAQYPLASREDSKLLVYDGGMISHRRFKDLPTVLDRPVLFVRNNTKVIPARLLCRKETGAWIEIFLLEPKDASRPVEAWMSDRGKTIWRALVGNRKKWKPGEVLRFEIPSSEIHGCIHDAGEGEIEMVWEPKDVMLSELLERWGETPIPPYLKRAAVPIDRERYQTVYAQVSGAVAAPTAGLHFTTELIKDLSHLGHSFLDVTLHVGAGTFLPVKEKENAAAHPMHQEVMSVSREALKTLYHLKDEFVISIGTTSCRWLESTYWLGLLWKHRGHCPSDIPQHIGWEGLKTYPKKEVWSFLLEQMEKLAVDRIQLPTQVMILPGYAFQGMDGLITNFHQPSSTLMLLIAAWIGEDWKAVYQSALQEDYRFLSYGDSSLLWAPGKSSKKPGSTV